MQLNLKKESDKIQDTNIIGVSFFFNKTRLKERKIRLLKNTKNIRMSLRSKHDLYGKEISSLFVI